MVLGLDQDGEQKLAVFSPGDGDVVDTFDNPRRATATAQPFNDGQGMVAFQEADGESTVTLYDGFDQAWQRTLGHAGPIRNQGIRAPQPITTIDDLNGDGTDEVALVKSSRRGGAKVELYAPARDELLDEIVLASYTEGDRSPLPGIHAQRLPDQTGDGVSELGIVAVTEGGTSSSANFYVVDPVEGDILVSGEGAYTRFAVFGNRIGLIGTDGSLTTVDPSAGVSLATAKAQSTLTLDWNFDTQGSYVTDVTINDRLVDRTTSESTSVRLPGGEFSIQIEATSADGISVWDSDTVTMTSDASQDLLLYSAATLAVGSVFGLGLVPKLKRLLRR